MSLLEVRDLSVEFATKRGPVEALQKVSLKIGQGEAVGVVGESGSGKSVTSLAIMGLLPNNARVTSGFITFNGREIPRGAQVDPSRRIAMIFQDPMTSLNPSFTVEAQLSEALKIHQQTPASALREKCLSYLGLVGIPDPASRLGSYPHQLSGGMAQRVMISMAMACEPQLLIADEPTTALDVTIQAQILSLIRQIQKERKLSLLLISHDMGVIAQNTSRVSVMYAGQVVEEGTTADVIAQPLHPYSQALLACLPSRHVGEGRRMKLPSIPGLVPDLLHRPPGCQFHPRCPKATNECQVPIPLIPVGSRTARCIHISAGAR